jgi:hypothetical protein
MKTSLPVILRKATPVAALAGLTLILSGCSSYQDQTEPFTYVHSPGYGESSVALPQDLRHYQRTPRPATQLRHHAAPPAEAFTGGS